MVQYDNLTRINKWDYNYGQSIVSIMVFSLIHPIPWINK
jgi:hypothetical protein